MHKINTLLLILLLFFISFANAQNIASKSIDNRIKAAPFRSIADNGINGIKVSYNFIDYNSFKKYNRRDEYSVLNITDFSHLQEVGKPALPSHIDLIAIPDGANYQLIINNDVPMVSKTTTIFPALQPARDTEGAPEPGFELDKEFYNTDQIFPQQSVRIIGEMKYHGIRMAMVEICPIQYNPVSSKLYIHSDINYEIVFSGANNFTDYSKHSKNFINQIVNYPLNYQSFAKESNDYYSQNLADNSTLDSKNYIIITHSDFEAAADTLANWKRQMGYSVEVISANNWTDTSVKAAVHTRYQNWSPKPDYLLIIGDDGDVPPETHYINGEPFGTDLYYVCMDGPSDFVPDMAKGRISPTNATNAMMQVHKIINYEKNPVSDTAFYQNGINCAQFQDDNTDGYADRRFLHTSEDIRTYINSQGYNSERIYYTDNNVTPTNYNAGYYSMGQPLPSVLLKSNGFNWNNGASEISTAINAGKFFVFHRDHGYSGGSGWAHPYFVNSSISTLNNGDKLPIVFSINCHTGEFTQNSCFAETFMRRTNGGSVGIFAASYYSYSGYNDGFSIGLIDGLWSNPGMVPNFGNGGISNPNVTPHNDIINMGDLLNHGLTRVVQTWGGNSSSNRYTNELFHYFGDPAMRIWTQFPDTITVSIVDTIGCSASSFAISNCNVADAVATFTGSGVLLGKTTLVNGSGTIPVSNLLGPYFEVTISAPNHKPFQKTIYLGSGGNLTVYKQHSNNICFGNNEAEIKIFPSCGNPPYSVLWSNGNTLTTLTNVATGVYSVIITDNANNTVYDTITVSGPSSAIQISATTTDAKCNFESSGSISVNVTGSTPPYTYKWQNGSSGADINNIAAGMHLFSVTDSFGCVYKDSFLISQPAVLNMQVSKTDDATGNCSGTATSAAVGGTPPYTYLWDDDSQQTTATATNLCAGLYKVKLLDNNLCALNRAVYVQNTVGIKSADNNSVISISPNPSNTGIFTINIENNELDNIHFNLYNSLGELLLQQKIISKKQNIDLSKYAQGVYYLHIANNNKSKVYKLIYQK